MRYAKINQYDVANGPGIRVSLFVSGCRRGCPGCFNREAWDFEYGEEFTDETIDKILDYCDKLYIQGLSILGGDPLEPENVPEVFCLLLKFRARFGNFKDVWLWTGFELDIFPHNYRDVTDMLIQKCDYIVDGPWKQELKDLSKRFRGSSNQKIYKVTKHYRKDSYKGWEAEDVSNQVDLGLICI